MHQVEILGIGAPIIDNLLEVSNQYLNQLPGEKYGMEIVEYDHMIEIINNSGSIPKLISGGSSANTIKGLANLGHNCAFTGKIGTDAHGKKISKDFQSLDVKTFFQYSLTPTANVLCLITPDGKRTFFSFLGASLEMLPSDLSPQFFKGAKLVHIEGYTLITPDLTQKAMEMAKKAGALVSFDLGSFSVVEKKKKLIIDLISEYVDILFANEDETLTLTGSDPSTGCQIINKLCSIAIIMVGDKGCWVGQNDHIKHFPTTYVVPVDTTGAGDLFACGFLHGLVLNKPVDSCVSFGSLMASTVIGHIGAEIPKKHWQGIKSQLTTR